jgi:RHS repeat-associated protein
VAVRVTGSQNPQENGLFYTLGDQLGSTSVVTDSSGNKVGEMRYMPWGETRYEGSNISTSRKYTGQREDAGIELYYYNARWYDAGLGRFAQADLIVAGGIQGYDRYSYVKNSPVQNSDPSGHKGCTDAYPTDMAGCKYAESHPTPRTCGNAYPTDMAGCYYAQGRPMDNPCRFVMPTDMAGCWGAKLVTWIMGHETKPGVDKHKPYDDGGPGKGTCTVGYGHAFVPGKTCEDLGISLTGTYSDSQLDDWLRNDLTIAEAAVTDLVQVYLTPAQFDALVSFVFWLGRPQFMISSVRSLLNAGDYYGAAVELGNYYYSDKKPFSGLKNRRDDEFALFNYGDYFWQDN